MLVVIPRKILTVTITDTMIISMLAIADITASIAPPIADTMAPYSENVSVLGQ